MIQKTLKLIKEQTSLQLILCPDFTGIKQHKGQKYFNVVLNDRTSESKEFDKLKKFANKYNLIDIEPNGLTRVAIFPK
jgi:hypothetical protein